MSFIQSYTCNPATEKVVPKDAVVFRWSGLEGIVRRLREGHELTARDIADQLEAQIPARPHVSVPEPGVRTSN